MHIYRHRDVQGPAYIEQRFAVEILGTFQKASGFGRGISREYMIRILYLQEETADGYMGSLLIGVPRGDPSRLGSRYEVKKAYTSHKRTGHPDKHTRELCEEAMHATVQHLPTSYDL